MDINTVNFSNKTNMMAGSPEFDLTGFYIQRCGLPGISFSHPEAGGRTSNKFSVVSDTAVFGELSMDILVDENLLVYNELMQTVMKQTNTQTGNFNQKEFEFWIVLTDSFGKTLIKWNFYGCKIESIGDIDFDYTDESTEYLMSISIKYDKFDFVHYGANSNSIPTLNV